MVRMLPQMPSRPFITDLSLAGLRDALERRGEPTFRWKQIAKWLYQKRVESFDRMTNVSKATRAGLAEAFRLEKLTEEYRRVSRNGDAVKFGFHAGEDIIETVVLYDRERRTACVSSQLGCGLKCAFCETGRMGFIRNLSLHEITGQLIAVNDYLAQAGDKSITRVVFMGMGEALSNFDAFRDAVGIICDENGLGLAPKRITVSTAGVVPSIRRLMGSGLGVGLAISLNTYNDEKRNAIMPINGTYPIAELIGAGEEYTRSTGADLTFEYVVVHGDNDTPEAVRALVRLLARVPCKLNLIPINPGTDTPSPATPSAEDLRAFADALYKKGVTVTRRTSRGQDIFGACGQLAGKRNRTDA
ncbi:MAG: 23S rRNA (adenine(2503)-C(2))-methyltransferase RlmN [Chitinivibrionales bacterium]|nr:23S rRNA (adenine(2503)-C(2))-methyltransferase RlmN [Chitinivibrionales bacterium]MBD3396911.1 23S rRNA (adenine(2503)-C(2))-methyltransferase RlmN [Chitinivibrionales bacterium]